MLLLTEGLGTPLVSGMSSSLLQRIEAMFICCSVSIRLIQEAVVCAGEFDYEDASFSYRTILNET